MKANDFVRKFGWEKAKEFSQIIIKGLCKKFDFEINTGESIELAYVDLNDLKRLVESHEIVEKHGGLHTCKLILKSVDSNESEYGSRLGIEYKKSFDGVDSKALMFCDDGNWCPSSYLNFELDDESKFVNLGRLKKAIADVEACK